jgi:polar amino acid transport system substrate-binding protein
MPLLAAGRSVSRHALCQAAFASAARCIAAALRVESSLRKFVVGTLAAVLIGLFAVHQAEAEAKCEPNVLATKYPSLTGRTIKVAQDPQGPPYAFRDPENFDQLIGLDADLVRATFACIELKTGSWSGLLPSVIARQADIMWSNLYYTRPAPSRSIS